jgi:small subunit ribosomal protein S18
MTQFYEIYLILNPLNDSKEIDAQVKTIQTILESEVGAKNLEINKEGSRRLSYPINKSWNGFYVLINFELEVENLRKINIIEKKFNLNSQIWRYIIINQTEFLNNKSKETLRETEIDNHRELNKTKKKKVSFPDFLGLKDVDYKDIAFLNQFTSPYAKIFDRKRTGTSAKFQRKITTSIKRARHMALMPFTTKHFE